MMECLTNLVNVTLLQEEIEIARPTGDLDTVFSKYCNKKSIALECVKNYTNSIEPCLEPEESKQKIVFIKIVQDLLKFVCLKDGNHIACKCFRPQLFLISLDC